MLEKLLSAEPTQGREKAFPTVPNKTMGTKKNLALRGAALLGCDDLAFKIRLWASEVSGCSA